MGFDQRPPASGGIDPSASPTLPIGDTSQGHDIPTGIAPSLAKLQDWTAWLRTYGVFYLDPVGAPGLIANDVTIGGDLTVTEDVDIAGTLSVGSSAAVGTDLTVGDDLAAAGDASVGGTLTVLTGIDVTGPLNITGNVDASGFVDTASYVVFSGTQPASNADPGANRAHALSLTKVSGTITTDGIGGATVQDGLGIASASASSGAIRVTFARAFANNNYTPISISGNGGDEYCVISAGTSTAAFVDIIMRSVSTGLINPAATPCVFYLHVTGRH